MKIQPHVMCGRLINCFIVIPFYLLDHLSKTYDVHLNLYSVGIVWKSISDNVIDKLGKILPSRYSGLAINEDKV